MTLKATGRSRRLWVVLFILCAALGLFVLRTLHDAGTFRTIVAFGPTDCWKVHGVVGGEDLHWRPGDREVFVSSMDRRTHEGGSVYLLRPFDGDGPRQITPLDVTPPMDFAFHPHGISLWVDDEGRERLFVVNHRTHVEHSVELFDVDPEGRLTHFRSVEGEALVSPNDVVAVGPEQFYVTNDHGTRSLWTKAVEDYLQLGLGNVLFFDGEHFSVAYKGTKYANGINMSQDGTKIYIAETIGQRITMLERDPQSNALQVLEVLDVSSGVDNIDIAQDGSLWVASHPQLLSFGAHAGNSARRSAAEVLRLTHGENGGLESERIYMSDGDPLSAPATATVRGGLMFIGPVFDPFLLVCDLGR